MCLLEICWTGNSAPFKAEAPSNDRDVFREAHGSQHLGPEHAAVAHLHPLPQLIRVAATSHSNHLSVSSSFICFFNCSFVFICSFVFSIVWLFVFVCSFIHLLVLVGYIATLLDKAM